MAPERQDTVPFLAPSTLWRSHANPTQVALPVRESLRVPLREAHAARGRGRARGGPGRTGGPLGALRVPA